MTLAAPTPRLVALLLALALWPLSAMGQDKVGINTAVNPSASGTPPGGEVRKIVVGQAVLYNEHIATGATGQTEILFLDQSALTVGPNADLVIDEFVYDPRTSQGKLAISVNHGMFRYVGGKLSKSPSGVTIRTPTSVVGIRGGEILLNVDAGGKVDAILVYGKALTVTGKNGCSQELERVGYALTTSGPNGCPSAGHPVSVAAITGYLTQLDGLPGAHAGATTTPTDQVVAASGVPATISGNLAGNVLALNQIQPAPPVNPSTLEGSFQQGNVQGQKAIPTATAPPSPMPVSLGTFGGFVSSLSHDSGAFYGTLSYPSSSFQNGAVSVTVADVVNANNNIVLHNGQTLSSVPNLTTFLSGFSGGAVISPLTVGTNNVSLSIVVSYNGVPLPTPTPTTSFALNLGVVATGTATVSPDGQFVTANLVLNGPGIAQFESLTGTSPTKVDNSGVPGSSLFLFSGVPTVTMPTAGVGNYSGTATGTVANGASQYSATGTFNENYNFATLNGTLNIGNFDNANYTAPISGSGNTYAGTLSGVGRTGSVAGHFFGPSAAETGGTFSINGVSGPRYIAAGIFTGH